MKNHITYGLTIPLAESTKTVTILYTSFRSFTRNTTSFPKASSVPGVPTTVL